MTRCRAKSIQYGWRPSPSMFGRFHPSRPSGLPRCARPRRACVDVCVTPAAKWLSLPVPELPLGCGLSDGGGFSTKHSPLRGLPLEEDVAGQAKQRPYVATTEQVWALHDAMPEHLRVSVLLGAFVGLRVAEAAALRVLDVDFMRAVVKPAIQYPAEPLKSETSKTAIPIPNELALMLAATVQEYGGETVVTNEIGRSSSPWSIERAIRSSRSQVDGLPEGFRFHDLRHYLASLLIGKGCDVKVVQSRLRHANATTTLNTYGHLWPDNDETTRNAIVSALRVAPLCPEESSSPR